MQIAFHRHVAELVALAELVLMSDANAYVCSCARTRSIPIVDNASLLSATADDATSEQTGATAVINWRSLTLARLLRRPLEPLWLIDQVLWCGD